MAGNAALNKLATSNLVGMVQPLHIADMAVYLASDEAAVTTGQIMVIDSGVTIY
jgi:enoyl-[acyl-carrier-protein] reductase (NADH)